MLAGWTTLRLCALITGPPPVAGSSQVSEAGASPPLPAPRPVPSPHPRHTAGTSRASLGAGGGARLLPSGEVARYLRPWSCHAVNASSLQGLALSVEREEGLVIPPAPVLLLRGVKDASTAAPLCQHTTPSSHRPGGGTAPRSADQKAEAQINICLGP